MVLMPKEKPSGTALLMSTSLKSRYLLQTVSCSLAWKHVKRLFLYSRHTVCLLESYSRVLTVRREKQKHKDQVF